MRKRTWITAALAALAIAAIAAPVAQARQFEGEIVAHNAKTKTFKIREDQGGGTFKVKVNKSTVYQGISGFKAIRVGRTDLEVVAQEGRRPLDRDQGRDPWRLWRRRQGRSMSVVRGACASRATLKNWSRCLRAFSARRSSVYGK